MSKNKIIENFIDIKEMSYDKKYSRVAKLHKYWSRKPWFIVKNYIEKYSNSRDTVLDPFCGSGIIGLESILANRDFVGYDLNPLAIFLGKNTLKINFNEEDLQNDFNIIRDDVRDKILSLYKYKDRQYILYTILGYKNQKKYNGVIVDDQFKNKQKIKLNNNFLNPKIKFTSKDTYPDKDFPKKFYKDRFSYKGVSKVSDMFTSRNLLALSILFNSIHNSKKLKYKDLILLSFTNTLLHVSKLKSENVRPLSVNNFWMPDDYIEENVWWRFEDRFNNVKLAKNTVKERSFGKQIGAFSLKNKSSLKMKDIKDESIDYIITDPPYGDTIQYSELSFIWNCWIEKDFKNKNEVIINPVQDKGVKEYSFQMEKSISEISRVLKKNKNFTLAFQNKNINIWIAIANIIYEKGMVIKEIDSYDTFGHPYNKKWSKFSPKSDFYVTFKNSKKKKILKSNESISPHDLIQEIIERSRPKNENDLFDLNKGYDMFVSLVLEKIFNGYKLNSDFDKLNVKKIILLFEKNYTV